jgi:hypothetical protein
MPKFGLRKPRLYGRMARVALLARRRRELMRPRETLKIRDQKWLDWRGWITLAWVLCCGWAYAVMAVKARGPLVLDWIRALGKWLGWS